MKTSALLLAALAATTYAQSAPYYDQQSQPFHLVIKSDNATIDGQLLGACHQGAAIEGLCLSNTNLSSPHTAYTTFYHNLTEISNSTDHATDVLGVLNYELLIVGNITVPSAMRFILDPGSNLANPIFSPGWTDYTLVSFAKCEDMYIPASMNDTVSPPEYYEEPLKLMNWYICLTRYSYLYETLVWRWGVFGEPQNPSCQKVSVTRVWL